MKPTSDFFSFKREGDSQHVIKISQKSRIFFLYPSYALAKVSQIVL